MIAKKRLLLILAAILMVLAMLPVSAGTVYAVDADTTSPTIELQTLGVTYPEGKEAVTSGETVTVSMSVADEENGSGMGTSYICYKMPQSGKTTEGYFRYNAASGKVVYTKEIDEVAESGSWQVKYIKIYDKSYNLTELYDSRFYPTNNDAVDLSAGDFTVTQNCRIIFDTNGGSEIAPQYVIPGEKATEPEKPAKDDYVFGGWYADEALTEPFDFETSVNKDITLYAKWIEDEVAEVTISIGVYDQTNAVCGQGGTYTFNAEDMTHTIGKHTVPKLSSVELVAVPAAGYEFAGWYEGRIAEGTDDLRIEPVGEVGSAEPSGQFNPIEDVVLCAVFKKSSETPSDTAPPQFNVESLSVAVSGGKEAALLGDTITISIEILDDSALKYADLYLMSPASQQSAADLVYNEKTGKWEWSGIVTDQAIPGLWKVYGFIAEDVYGNVGSIVNSNIAEDSSMPSADLSAGDVQVEIMIPSEPDDGSGSGANPASGGSGNGAGPASGGAGTNPGAVTGQKFVNPMMVQAKTVKIKLAKIKKKKQTIKPKKAFIIENAQGVITYKITGVKKAKFKKFFKINARSGKITVRKGLKKGTYKLKVTVTAAGNSNYLAGSKTVTLKVKVR